MCLPQILGGMNEARRRKLKSKALISQHSSIQDAGDVYRLHGSKKQMSTFMEEKGGRT